MRVVFFEVYILILFMSHFLESSAPGKKVMFIVFVIVFVCQPISAVHPVCFRFDIYFSGETARFRDLVLLGPCYLLKNILRWLSLGLQCLI